MARAAAAKFIHFGLPKCGSTFLQNLWGEDKGYTGADLGQAAQVSRQLAAKGQTGNLPRMSFTVKARGGSTLVATSEGFSWAFLGRPHLLERIRDLHKIGAAITGATGASDTALFMVRNPADWIRAAHEQTVKEGGFMSGADFLDQRRALVECVLDLKHIREVFGAHFKRVVFLSADEMRHNPETFWPRYENVLGAPKPADSVIDKVTRSDQYANRSLREKTAQLARLNRLLGAVGEGWREADNLPPDLIKERDSLLPKFDLSRVWAARRAAETLDSKALEGVLGGAFAEMGEGFTELQLDDALKAYLRTHVCDVLDGETTLPDELKASYRAALD
ncbi:MAG: hypothetical protein GYB36_04455 [Alphaproteobacteria bacterium]|nr:hypothetical protein [Alphaproteobacteria bacterium]